MAKPFDGSNEATEARLMELGNKRLQPLLDQRRQAAETDLINRGIRPGSTNYNQAQGNIAQGENDAYNQLLLTGRGQAFSEAQAVRNQPINEITALLSGSQVSTPQSQGFNAPNIPTTNTAGIIGQDYQNRVGQWERQQQMLGGLFGLGASIISDRRMKTEIKEIGKTKDGQKIFSYRYKTGGPIHIGLMADEVEERNPDAVTTLPGGVKAVNYGKALEKVS